MPSYSTATRTARMNAVLAAIDAGSGAGTLKIYAGTVPASVAASLGAATILGTLTLSDPAGTVSAGVLTFSAITQDSSADASGAPTFARIATSDGTDIVQLTAGVGSGELNMGANPVSGQPLQITSMSITEGNA